MFEFRLRILEVGENSYVGVVDWFPEVFAHAASIARTESELASALAGYLEGLRDRAAMRFHFDDFPTVRIVRVFLVRGTPSPSS